MEPFNVFDYSRILEENKRRIEKASEFKEPDRTPVVIGVGGPYYARLFGYTFAEYYNDLEVMLDAQIKGIKWRLRWLEDDFTDVSIRLDLGLVNEGIVFNCRVETPNSNDPWRSPWIVPIMRDVEDIDRLEVPDPHRHREIRKYYEKLESLKELTRKHYGNIKVDGILQIHPPVSAAGSLMGADRLYSWLYKYPNEMHKLFKKLLETYRVLQDYYYNVTGNEPGVISLADDHAGYLNRKMYERFVVPYNSQIYEHYGAKYRGLHMDSHMDHITDILVNTYKINEADVGVENDIRILSKAFKGKILFNGNADWRVLIGDPTDKIELEVERCIYYAAPGGGYIFDNGGETYVGIPPEKLKYEVEYAKKVGEYPIRNENFKHLNKVISNSSHKKVCGY